MGGLILAIIFALVALVYASIGFGGGSTYIAILALTDLSFAAMPIIALMCNIIVVTGGTIRFGLQRLIPWRRIWPILILSVPAAWLGGITPITQGNFMLLLGVMLIASAAMLSLRSLMGKDDKIAPHYGNNTLLCAFLAALIGYISGLVGIGGGIFLAPLLLLLRWASPREIAATASLFILFNSIAAITGQIGKYNGSIFGEIITPNLPLFIAVFIGGQMGSLLAVKVLPETIIRMLTIILTLYVGVRILYLA